MRTLFRSGSFWKTTMVQGKMMNLAVHGDTVEIYRPKAGVLKLFYMAQTLIVSH